MNRLCQAVGVGRAGYYRFLLPRQTQAGDMDLRSKIQSIALQWPAYGYRRVHQELIRQGWGVNHKRVLRLMRMDNLLCLRRRKFIFTTDSKHGLHIYPNLAKDMVLTDINQLWVADITYIRLEVEFVYLAVLLDAFSRSCIGWALQRSLEARNLQGHDIADEIEIIRHGRELAAHGVPRKKKSAIAHGHENAMEASRNYNDFSANGSYPLNSVSQSRGAPQYSPPFVFSPPSTFDPSFLTPVRSRVQNPVPESAERCLA